MDRSREQSKARDMAKRPDPYELSAETHDEKWLFNRFLKRMAKRYRDEVGRDLNVCPDCKHSTAFLFWDMDTHTYVHLTGCLAGWAPVELFGDLLRSHLLVDEDEATPMDWVRAADVRYQAEHPERKKTYPWQKKP